MHSSEVTVMRVHNLPQKL